MRGGVSPLPLHSNISVEMLIRPLVSAAIKILSISSKHFASNSTFFISSYDKN